MSVTSLSVAKTSPDDRDGEIARLCEESKAENYFPAAFIKAAAEVIIDKELRNAPQAQSISQRAVSNRLRVDKIEALAIRFSMVNKQRPFITFDRDRLSFKVDLSKAPEGMTNSLLVERAIRQKIGRMGFAKSQGWIREAGTGIIEVSSPAFAS